MPIHLFVHNLIIRYPKVHPSIKPKHSSLSPTNIRAKTVKIDIQLLQILKYYLMTAFDLDLGSDRCYTTLCMVIFFQLDLIRLNPHLLNGLVHPYQLDECISSFRGVWCTFSFSFNFEYHNDPKFLDRYAWANSADPDQGLHCLPFHLHHLDSLLYGRAT